MPDGNQKALEALIRERNPGLLKLPGDKKRELLNLVGSLVTTQGTLVTAQSFSGPLPPPETLRAYSDIIANGAERIMAMAEQQSRHRMALENQIVTSQVKQSALGQWLALAIALILIGAGIWLTLTGHDTVGGIIFGTTVVGLGSVFVMGKYGQKRNLDQKASK